MIISVLFFNETLIKKLMNHSWKITEHSWRNKKNEELSPTRVGRFFGVHSHSANEFVCRKSPPRPRP